MWLVWSNDDGILTITDDKEKAIKEYESVKKWLKNSFECEFYGDEMVILAKIEKQFFF